jgi:hypothetical protein
VFLSKFLPEILKLADLSHTGVTRHAAAQIIIAASNLAVAKKCLSGSLLNAYQALCQDTDSIIRKDFLTNINFILKKVDPKQAETEFFEEVPQYTDYL